MGMFTSYDCLADNYTPNNIKPPKPNTCDCPSEPSNLSPRAPKKPYEDYNVKNELIGYWWYYGDTINLDFHITGDIIVEDDAIIYTAINDKPTEQTVGRDGQKAYNITDLKSWTCSIDSSTETIRYIWTEDEQFENPEEGSRNIYVSAEEFVKDKFITFTLYNFRWEEIDKKTYNGTTDIIYEIDADLSKKLVKGVYYGKLVLWDNDLNNEPKIISTLFESNDCTFTVK